MFPVCPVISSSPVHCALCSAHLCTVHSSPIVKCALYNVHCTLHTVPCTLYAPHLCCRAMHCWCSTTLLLWFPIQANTVLIVHPCSATLFNASDTDGCRSQVHQSTKELENSEQQSSSMVRSERKHISRPVVSCSTLGSLKVHSNSYLLNRSDCKPSSKSSQHSLTYRFKYKLKKKKTLKSKF